LGTVAIVWIIGAILILMAILYWFNFWPIYTWAGIFCVLLFMGTTPFVWAVQAGTSLGLREKANPALLYEAESNYCYVAVEQLSKEPDTRQFIQDDLKTHSKIVMGNIEDLQFIYTKILAAVTHLTAGSKTQLSTLFMGGGGYVLPRYIEAGYPGSSIEVAEIDPGVTKAATAAFGLAADTSIRTFQTDARNYVDSLLEKKKGTSYDIIYGDAFGASIIPFQLTTKEFNDKLAALLKPDGVYLINLVDVYPAGKFLGSILKTLKQTFPFVYITTDYKPYFMGNNFIVVASRQKIDIEKIRTDTLLADQDMLFLDDFELGKLEKKPGVVLLTDDYAPVEQLLAPFIALRGKFDYVKKFLDEGDRLKDAGQYQQSIPEYNQALDFAPELTMAIYYKLVDAYAKTSQVQNVIDICQKAIEYAKTAPLRIDVSEYNYYIGVILMNSGKTDESRAYLEKAIQGFKNSLEKRPAAFDLNNYCGNALSYAGRFEEALPYFQKTIAMEPLDADLRMNYVAAFMYLTRYTEAMTELQSAINFFRAQGKEEATAPLIEFLNNFEAKKGELVRK